MKYLCLIYHEEAQIDAMSESEYNAIMDEVRDYRDELRASGHYIASGPLESVWTATTVRVRNGKLHLTDGPFAETKEQLGGFFLIDARDLNDAIRVASKMPPARIGSIEVRPIKEYGSAWPDRDLLESLSDRQPDDDGAGPWASAGETAWGKSSS